MTERSHGSNDTIGAATPPQVLQVTEDLVLIEVAGRRVLAEARCPHRKGLLKFGHVDGARLRIRCQLHHSTFDLQEGAVVTGPACSPLRIVAHLSGSEHAGEDGR